MVTKTKSELVLLTRELAKEFATMQAVPGERDLKPVRLKHFEHRLAEGKFNSPSWAIAVRKDRAEKYRADGQHTSRALMECPDEQFPVGLYITINTYEVDDWTDLPELFDLFDNPISARSNVDKMCVFAAEYTDLTGLDRGYLAKATHGIDYHYRLTAKPGEEEHKLYVLRSHGLYLNEEQHRLFVIWLYRWHAAKHAWMIGKPGLAAEMFADWVADPDIAAVFWGEVFDESNPEPDALTRELSSTLKDWTRKPSKVPQERFRGKARKIWELYRRELAVRPPAARAA